MPHQHGPWTVESSQEIYRNQFIQVIEDQVVQPDGQPGHYATVKSMRGVSVLPLDEDNTAYLVQQFRYAIGRDSLEVPSGSLDDGESLEEAARRELREELGIEAGELLSLGVIDMDTSIVWCPVHLYIARKLTFEEKEREGTEVMQTVKVPFEDAVRQVMDSAITHSPSCALLLKAALTLR